jgi:hypothetical protein
MKRREMEGRRMKLPHRRQFLHLAAGATALPRQTLHLPTRKNCSDNRGHLRLPEANPSKV